MTSQPAEEIIHIVFTMEDVESLAEVLKVPIEVARSRAESWAKSIENSAVERINEQLASVIEHDTRHE